MVRITKSKITFCFLFSIFLFSCAKKQNIDAIYFNGIIYTVDSNFSTAQSFAVKDGKIVDVGSNDLKEKYSAKEIIDLKGKAVYPGFIDAHCHFYGYSTDLVKCNLYGTKIFCRCN